MPDNKALKKLICDYAKQFEADMIGFGPVERFAGTNVLDIYPDTKTVICICCPLTGITTLAGDTRLVFQAPAGFYNWRIAGNGSGYHRDFFMLFRFCCLSVLHAANIGVVDFHRLWCVLGPLMCRPDIVCPNRLGCPRCVSRSPVLGTPQSRTALWGEEKQRSD